jgi:hypothetical protein
MWISDDKYSRHIYLNKIDMLFLISDSTRTTRRVTG